MKKAITKLAIEIIESSTDGMSLVEALSDFLSQSGVRAKISMEFEIEPVPYKEPTLTCQAPQNVRRPTLTPKPQIQPEITPVPELNEMTEMFGTATKTMTIGDIIKADKKAPAMVDEEGYDTNENEVIFHGSEGRLKKKYPAQD